MPLTRVSAGDALARKKRQIRGSVHVRSTRLGEHAAKLANQAAKSQRCFRIGVENT